MATPHRLSGVGVPPVSVILPVLILLALFGMPVPSFPQPQQSKLFRHHSTVVWSCNSSQVPAFVYQAGLAVDADGAYRAYHPNNRLGLDSIEHAGHPGNWWALATDTGTPKGRPLVQGKNDPALGYYVSMTSLFDASIHDEHNPRRFVDAQSIPYVVLPPKGFKHAKLGDFATVVNLRSGKVEGAIVADESAPEVPMGEGSMALADALGIDSNPRSGGVQKGVAYVIFPGSGNGKPRALDEIVSASQAYFQRWGGLPRLDVCLKKSNR
ncbi:MAG TPA: glycoside hydrolase family 75 protein [Terriglobales bacterium]|nr:glycoside hydrolase family 75 protein [Terriglobales bacterium]